MEEQRTLNRINIETKVMGVSMIYLVMFIGLLSLPLITTPILFVIILPVIIILIKKFKKASTRGCPDYLSELSNNLVVKKEFSDDTTVMSKL